MTSLKLALGSLTLCLLQACASLPPAPPQRHSAAANDSAECPPLFGKVCYGPTDRPDLMRCGCSSVSPLGTPYP
jgi:hypothetical protein